MQSDECEAMNKILTLFVRREDDPRLISDKLSPGCEWVLAGLGKPTLKWDGAAVLVRGGILFARYDFKRGGKGLKQAGLKEPPPGWVPCQDEPDAKGHWPGWVPAERPEDKWLREAFEGPTCPDGTYEACGPKIGSNPHGFPVHVLIPHGSPSWPGAQVGVVDVMSAPRSYDGLREWFASHVCEGIVWHRDDGLMAKAKRRDFGFAWPPEVKP